MDTLFLLEPDFIDSNVDQEGKKYYCPYCAAVEGVLSYYPQLKQQLEIIYVGFEKPRKAIVDLIGEANQSCPVLVIDADRYITDNGSIKTFKGNWFINSTNEILNYLAETYNVGSPHP